MWSWCCVLLLLARVISESTSFSLSLPSELLLPLLDEEDESSLFCCVGAPRRRTHHTVRNNAGRKTVIAFRTRASSEPLADRLGVRLGVVCIYLGCWPVDSLPQRRRRNFVFAATLRRRISPPFASHQPCMHSEKRCVREDGNGLQDPRVIRALVRHVGSGVNRILRDILYRMVPQI